MAKFIQMLRARRRACCLIFVLVFAVHDAAHAGQRGPLLSFLQTTESGYQWMFWRPGNAQAKLFAATQVGDDGKTWKVLTRLATKDLAGDTPGVSVVDDLRHERGASNDRLLESYTCNSAPCRNDVPAALLQRASAESGSNLESDETSIWRPGKDLPSIMFRTVMGDQLHMAPPVLLLAPDDGSIQPVEMQGRKQLGLGIEHSLLLLADETTGARPMVVDLKRGTVQFQAEGWGATWVPRTPTTK